MRFLWVQRNLLYFLWEKGILFRFLLKLYACVLSWIDLNAVLELSHVCFGLIEAEIVLASKIIKYPLWFEVHSELLFFFYDSFDPFNGLLIRRTKKDLLAAVLLRRQRFDSFHIGFFSINTLVFDSEAKRLSKVHTVSRKKGHTVPLRYDHLVISRPICAGHIEIVWSRVVLPVFEMEEGDSELEKIEVDGGLFDAFIEFAMVREHTLDLGELSH